MNNRYPFEALGDDQYFEVPAGEVNYPSLASRCQAWGKRLGCRFVLRTEKGGSVTVTRRVARPRTEYVIKDAPPERKDVSLAEAIKQVDADADAEQP